MAFMLIIDWHSAVLPKRANRRLVLYIVDVVG